MIKLRRITDINEAFKASCDTKLRHLRTPGLLDWQIDVHWDDAVWLEIKYKDKLGYAYYTMQTPELVEVHGFAADRKSAAFTAIALSKVLEYIKEHTTATKCFITVPSNAMHVLRFLYKIKFHLEGVIDNGIIHGNEYADLHFLTRKL